MLGGVQACTRASWVQPIEATQQIVHTQSAMQIEAHLHLDSAHSCVCFNSIWRTRPNLRDQLHAGAASALLAAW